MHRNTAVRPARTQLIAQRYEFGPKRRISLAIRARGFGSVSRSPCCSMNRRAHSIKTRSAGRPAVSKASPGSPTVSRVSKRTRSESSSATMTRLSGVLEFWLPFAGAGSTENLKVAERRQPQCFAPLCGRRASDQSGAAVGIDCTLGLAAPRPFSPPCERNVAEDQSGDTQAPFDNLQGDRERRIKPVTAFEDGRNHNASPGRWIASDQCAPSM